MFRKGVLAGVMAVMAVGGVQVPAVSAHADGPGLTVVAGTGVAGSSGDGGPATQAQLRNPLGIAAASSGAVYLADTGNHTVRMISPEGVISTIAGTGRQNSAAANSGPVIPADVTVPSGAKGTAFSLAAPTSIALAPDGTLYIADTGLFRVFALAPDGHLSVLAGTGTPAGAAGEAGPAAGEGGPAAEAALGQPGGLAVAPDGTVYIGDLDRHLIRAVAPNGTITTVAGNGGSTLTAAGGPATETAVADPDRLAVDSAGAVWLVADQTLLRLADGNLATATMSGSDAQGTWSLAETGGAVQSSSNSLVGVAASGQTVYALDGRDQSVRRLRSGYHLDTIATGNHSITGPIAVAGADVLYLIDNSNSRVYALRPPAPASGDTGNGISWRSLAVGGAAAVVVLGAVLLVAVRRRER
ncbi:MAG: hypothetical protein JXA67_14050 [Micromonosporaceae bacterium]|nr:hypothetical protein [Micromonosporaceae bacterium]